MEKINVINLDIDSLAVIVKYTKAYNSSEEDIVEKIYLKNSIHEVAKDFFELYDLGDYEDYWDERGCYFPGEFNDMGELGILMDLSITTVAIKDIEPKIDITTGEVIRLNGLLNYPEVFYIEASCL